MSEKKNPLLSNQGSNAGLFQPQASLRHSSLWQDGKPDTRLVKLIHLLAQVTALEHFEAECEANKEKKKNESNWRQSGK
ncbi:MAG: hypothetical protein JJ964_16600 [Rhizobiales bacterium]|nr:hypothetical protein [Hyphomicrobiales bacterium]